MIRKGNRDIRADRSPPPCRIRFLFRSLSRRGRAHAPHRVIGRLLPHISVASRPRPAPFPAVRPLPSLFTNWDCSIASHAVSLVSVFLQMAGVAQLVRASRSEEHTSELQSRENLVCRLLLEKKNKLQIT